MNFLYVLGTGSRFQDLELRFSLRSLRYADVDQVILVGEKPPWVQNVTHIEVPDIGSHKAENTQHKLLRACQDSRVPKQFELMNDDFFLLDRYEPKAQHKGPLAESIEQHSVKKGPYFYSLTNTYFWLVRTGIKHPLDYSLHKPMTMVTADLLTVLLMPHPAGCLTRTLYGNTVGLVSTPSEDVKAHRLSQFRQMWEANAPLISIGDGVPGSPWFRERMIEKFPDMSPYESEPLCLTS